MHSETKQSSFSLVALVIFVFGIIQTLFISRPSVNLEWAFVEAAMALAELTPLDRIDHYFYYQANPLGYSLVGALLLLIGSPFLSSIEPIVIVRLPSIIGGIVLLVSAADIYKTFFNDRKNFKVEQTWLVILLASHPMIWLYSNNSTADILPAGLMLGAFAFCLRGQQLGALWHFPGIFLFAIACIVKFNCALMGFGFIPLLFFKRPNSFSVRTWVILFSYIAAPLVCLIVYF